MPRTLELFAMSEHRAIPTGVDFGEGPIWTGAVEVDVPGASLP